MRNLVLALLMSTGVMLGATGGMSAQAAAFSNPGSPTNAAHAGDFVAQVRHRSRGGVYFGFYAGPRYWFPDPYYYGYPPLYSYPYYGVPRYFQRCWRVRGTSRLVCRWYRRW